VLISLERLTFSGYNSLELLESVKLEKRFFVGLGSDVFIADKEFSF
jgi:hypothetical protein